MADGHLILAAGALLAGGLVASFVAMRLQVPSLVLFLGVGMLVGSDALGWITLDSYRLARTVGVISLVLILFEGGLTTEFVHLRPVLAAASSLATVGTAITAAVTGLSAASLFGFSTKDGLLLGAVLSSTDGAAIFALLRGSSLSRKLAQTLEGESGLNDPVAVLLVLGFIDLLTQPGYGAADFVLLFVRELGIGLLVGMLAGFVAVYVLRRVRLSTAGLYPVATLTVAALAYGGADTLHGSGFLSVYLAGLMIGSADIPAERTVVNFHQGLGWLAQVAMFLTLGLLVFPSQLASVALNGTILALVLVFVARPVAVAVATLPFAYSWRERSVLGWAGLRGAVPVVLATFPVIEHVSHSRRVLQHRLLRRVGVDRAAGIDARNAGAPLGPDHAPSRRCPGRCRSPGRSGASERRCSSTRSPPGTRSRARGVSDLGLPRDAVVSVIVREDRAIPPRGSTQLRAGRRAPSSDQRGVSSRHPRPPRALANRTDRPAATAASPATGRRPIFTVWSWNEQHDGDVSRPRTIADEPVVDQLRIRRDQPGGLWVLADGRYAITGPLAAVGSRRDLTEWSRRRMRNVTADELAWLQNVIGALAADRTAPATRPSDTPT